MLNRRDLRMEPWVRSHHILYAQVCNYQLTQSSPCSSSSALCQKVCCELSSTEMMLPSVFTWMPVKTLTRAVSEMWCGGAVGSKS